MRWWQTGVVYQIYPRSFQDSNGDGVGDLAGIMRRLPYLVDLGIDAIWLSPIYSSPMADFGYDIADYCDIDPLFGTLTDFDKLVEDAHLKGLKVILDFVPNHTSDRHPWFVESRGSRHNQKRDWYIWKEPRADGAAPNNWLSDFGGGAWQYDAHTKQYYLHSFLAAQPDLNWRNVEVRQAMYDVMRFWLGRGVDGFRVDVIWHLIKDAEFRDNPPNPDFRSGEPPHHQLIPLYTADRPEIHDVIREMRQVLDEFADRVLIGEIYLPIERLVRYYGERLGGLHLPFNFALLRSPWGARSIAALIEEYESALPPSGWPNWVLGNHDRPRIASRVGQQQARIAAMLLLTLRGTPMLYYGDEIGMEQVKLLRRQIRDPLEKNIPGLALGRDACRTPMQWCTGRNAGFSSGESWLPVESSYGNRNVAVQRSDSTSIFHLHQRLLELRRRAPALRSGSYKALAATGELLLFLRETSEQKILVALNFGDQPIRAEFKRDSPTGTVLLSTRCEREHEAVHGTIDLQGNEGLIISVDPAADY